MTTTPAQHEKARKLRALHLQPPILVLVNAWDVASARAVAAVPGCRAVATASHSIAAAHGYDDGEHMPVELMVTAIARIAAAVDLPVTADLEAGYGDAAGTVRAAIRAGAVGGNLEDAMAPLDHAVRAVEAAGAASRAENLPFVLNARTDAYLAGPPETALTESIERGTAYLAAGADCVFVPGCTDPDDIRELVAAFGPGRLSLLGVPGTPEPARLEALGVARVSYGPYPQRWALDAMVRRAQTLLRGGR
ncbi:isocitrate lyase/phosphoenolpyruvate mutase family protein [Planosporangium thailandense]|uniref:Isocitrate lyase/phosphoenolpyruvate mutase family protein n=1 Tax=Planosporangium thailandense TaxID=765197 RepID=A0ABX0Y541_9ACTN|nr:isocitrate lyase/phosphoenolpyruvate mutase family protein [Planosporangium thailandense]NJC73532.1 isocitrate lyase/phosphoenolpyruvate mutase family protein [Planosporangium thailandense]